MTDELLRIMRMYRQLSEVERLDERDFLRFEFDLVRHYRRHEADQEWIAVAVQQKNLGCKDPVVRERTGEIIAMLAHVHDPLISAIA